MMKSCMSPGKVGVGVKLPGMSRRGSSAGERGISF